MMTPRAIGSFSLLSMLLLPSAVFGQNDGAGTCNWQCRIDLEFERLGKQLHWLAGKWSHLFPQYESENDPFPDYSFPWEPAQTHKPISTPVIASKLFGTPSWTPTTSSWLYATSTPASVLKSSFTSNNISPLKPPKPSAVLSMGGHNGYKAVAYFADWSIYGRAYDPSAIPADKLTHVLYAFADNRDTGEVYLTDGWADTDKHWPSDSWNDVGKNLYGCLKQINLLKKRNRNLKLLLSIGGWTYAHEQKHFDGPASTSQGRKTFADSCVKLIKDLGLDGIDIDWEYPQNPDQGNQLLLLLQAIRSAMDAHANSLASNTAYGGQKPHFALSIAAPAGETNYKNIPLSPVAKTVDFINLMGYDFAGSWDNDTGHQANLYPSESCPACTPFSIDKVVQDYINNGVPREKIVLGMPLYGRAFTNTAGIGKPFNGVGYADQDHGSWEAGVWDFKALPRPGATEYIDEEAGASYSYDNATQTLISYDTVEMAKRKASYIRKHDLGGAMWWELSGDRAHDSSIVANVVKELGGPHGETIEKRSNWLEYPGSQYDNVKAGFPGQ